MAVQLITDSTEPQSEEEQEALVAQLVSVLGMLGRMVWSWCAACLCLSLRHAQQELLAMTNLHNGKTHAACRMRH